MFNWTLFAILVLITAPGILVSLPQLLTQLEGLVSTKMTAEQKRPSRRTLLIAGLAQYLLLASAFAALGVWLAPKVGLSAPFFTILATGEWSWTTAASQLWPALLAGTGGALIFLAAYYKFFRPRFDPKTRQASEQLRHEMGLASRLLYGGIFEEVFARWGLMTLLVWIGFQVVGDVTAVVVWTAIVISGVLFGLSHLPNYVMAGSRATPFFIAYMIVMNLWASLIFGWLLWQHGLLAAIAAHMLFHLLWWPLDQFFYRSEKIISRHQFDLSQIG